MEIKTYCLFLLSISSVFGEIVYPDFLVSMSREGRDLNKLNDFFHGNERYNDDCYRAENLKLYRTIYARNILLAKPPQETYRIPKIIHQIWLGSPVPVRYLAWMRSWTKWQGWEYKLWTDEDVQALPLYNQDLYDQSTNFGEKSDIVRLELLLHFGGIYADIDFECINSDVFDELHRFYDFYIGFEPIEHGTINNTYKICNAIMGACPHHPIIKNLIHSMRSNWRKFQDQSPVEKSGPDYFSRTIFDYEMGRLHSVEMKANNAEYRNIYLPCTFLYPFSEPDVRGAKSCQELIEKASPETAAIHYWSGSWLFVGGR
ncbi:MAG: hypothetical protein RLZZ453_163 [Chlamydiota bacterium]|jgi:hypothetical protein